MNYTPEEIKTYVKILCDRLNIPECPVSINPLMRTAFALSGVMIPEPFINIDPGCPFAAVMSMEVILAHEVRHWFQYQKGLLTPTRIGLIAWEGKPSSYVWHTAPWEIDAVLFENEIALELGYPIYRFVNNGTIFQLDKPADLDTNQKQLAIESRKAA